MSDRRGKTGDPIEDLLRRLNESDARLTAIEGRLSVAGMPESYRWEPTGDEVVVRRVTDGRRWRLVPLS